MPFDRRAMARFEQQAERGIARVMEREAIKMAERLHEEAAAATLAPAATDEPHPQPSLLRRLLTRR